MTNLGLWWNAKYVELEPTELAVGGALAILIGAAVLYVIIKVLRSRIVKLIGMGALLLTAAFIGWLVVDQQVRGERERIAQIWSRTFDNNEIKDFESCVANRSPRIAGTQYRVELVTECGEVAKAIKQGLEAR
ncbi:MAG: hypothetical protein NBKEAIPA_00937 [Nitrospirae bacterium]|nr:hypothetical protein [Nitrospirota bacterium]MCK6493258.1 hypothetical protein [Nitrospira sp.]MEB2338437.1 hypothetical protein [Nitrospirales bacterium]QOJ33830.1 MAG: hypothetical protein HRU82_02200 [Nitrospira sp.]